MTKQHYLIANKVLELLRNEVLPSLNQQQQQIYQNLVNQQKLLKGSLSNPNIEIPVLEQCADFLRSKGIHVCFRITKDYMGKPNGFCFVAGESGRVYERLLELTDRLELLQLFLADYMTKLPRKWVAEKKKVDEYIILIACTFMPLLEKAYLGDNISRLVLRCSICSDFADKVEAYLEKLKPLERAMYLETL